MLILIRTLCNTNTNTNNNSCANTYNDNANENGDNNHQGSTIEQPTVNAKLAAKKYQRSSADKIYLPKDTWAPRLPKRVFLQAGFLRSTSPWHLQMSETLSSVSSGELHLSMNKKPERKLFDQPGTHTHTDR